MASVFALQGLLPANGENNNLLAEYELRVDWGNGGTFGGTSDDVSTDVASVSVTYGRDFASQLTGKAIAGRLQVVLQNTAGKYNSYNSSSPIFGSILPGRRVRLISLTPYARPIFQGFLTSIVPRMDEQRNRVAFLEAEGPLSKLDTEARIAMQSTLTTDTALGSILNAVDWPATARDLDTGKTTMTRWWADGLRALTAAREVEATEAGFLRETRDGKIAFENRHARISGTASTSQATYTDSTGGTIYYTVIEQQDSWPLIYNNFTADVRLFGTTTSTVLWTHPEGNTAGSAPAFQPSETKVFWAAYPNPTATLNAVGVHSWTAPSATQDYNFFTDTGATGTNLNSAFAVTVTTFATAAKYEIQNTGTVVGYLTLLQARGAGVVQDDPVQVEALDATSTGTYGLRRFPRPAEARWTPDTDEAQNWADFNLGIYKDPNPIVSVTINANRDLFHMREALTRDISERVTVIATGTVVQLGIATAFFVESIRHEIQRDRYHRVTYELSAAAEYSDFWRVGISQLNVNTRPAF